MKSNAEWKKPSNFESRITETRVRESEITIQLSQLLRSVARATFTVAGTDGIIQNGLRLSRVPNKLCSVIRSKLWSSRHTAMRAASIFGKIYRFNNTLRGQFDPAAVTRPDVTLRARASNDTLGKANLRDPLNYDRYFAFRHPYLRSFSPGNTSVEDLYGVPGWNFILRG